MDPDKALEDLREFMAQARESGLYDDDTIVQELVDTAQALDEWLSKGGFLPKDWERK